MLFISLPNNGWQFSAIEGKAIARFMLMVLQIYPERFLVLEIGSGAEKEIVDGRVVREKGCCQQGKGLRGNAQRKRIALSIKSASLRRAKCYRSLVEEKVLMHLKMTGLSQRLAKPLSLVIMKSIATRGIRLM